MAPEKESQPEASEFVTRLENMNPGFEKEFRTQAICGVPGFPVARDALEGKDCAG